MEPTFDSRALRSKRVGLFGGTFDPPHLGHVFVAKEAARARGLEHVVWVPAKRSPHKGEAPTPGELRKQLIELTLLDAGMLDSASVWDGELVRPAPSLTLDSVHELAAAREAEGCAGGLHLLLGADQLLGIERWHKPEQLFQLVEPVVVARTIEGTELQALEQRLLGLADSGKLSRELAQRLIEAILDPGRVDVAATDLRRELALGGTESVSPSTLARILELGLFR